MIFSDTDVMRGMANGSIKITPFEPSLLKAASYSLTLGEKLFRMKSVSFIDARNDKQEYEELVMNDGGYLLAPGEFIVGASKERLVLSDGIAGFVSTTGSRAQHGLDACLSSVFVEPGTDNHIALEMHNAGNIPIKLFPGVRMAKIIFMRTESLAAKKGRGKDFFFRQGDPI